MAVNDIHRTYLNGVEVNSSRVGVILLFGFLRRVD